VRGRLLLAGAALFAVVGAVGAGLVSCGLLPFQPSCVVALQPGPTANALEIVEIAGTATYPPSGELVMTTVAVDAELDVWEWLQTFALRDTDRVSRESLFPDGLDHEELRRRTAAQMGQSQTIAAAAGLRAAGYELDLAPAGAEVAGLIPGLPGEDALEVHDIILAVDGEPVSDAAAASAAIRATPPGTAVELTVRREGRELAVGVELAEPPAAHGDEGGVVGAFLQDHVTLPVDVRFEVGQVGGPSAGLMFALSVVDLLTEEDLTGGAVVAGTGSIDAEGDVGAIGGVRQKLSASADRPDAPVDVFLVPEGNLEDARGAAVAAEVIVVPVGHLDDAVAALRALRDGRTPEGAFALGG
jgi:Lon-like protease